MFLLTCIVDCLVFMGQCDKIVYKKFTLKNKFLVLCVTYTDIFVFSVAAITIGKHRNPSELRS